MSLLVADRLTVSLAHATGPAPVLRGVSLSLAPGRVLGLVGESGAGKSMLGRAVAGALPRGFAVSGGTLSFDDADLLALRPAARRALLGRDIAFIPQEPLSALNPVRSIASQFAEHLAHAGVPRRARRARMLAALEAVHLPEPAALLARFPHQLSGGMCQRVLIAMAFASEPLLVVADEPTTALDATIQARVMALMAELQARHRTAVLFITHDLRLAASVCDEIAVLYAGAIVEQGPARQVLAAPRHPYTRCLLLANPPLTGPPRALYALPDQMPGLLALAGMRGCRFAPRCPLAEPACRTTDPALPDGPHRAACLRMADTPTIAITAPPPAPPARSGATLLAVEGLSKSFVTGPMLRRRTTLAVDGASFTVGAGEFVAVVGESGSGKTTLGRLLMGLEHPTAGRILLAGRDIGEAGEAARRHRVATAQMVFQDSHAALNPRRRVASIATQALEAAGVPAPERTRRAAELLAAIGLPPETAGRVPAQLSGGQRQRVNIARALCLVPRLLVADEIVSGLDVSVQAQLLMLLQRLRAELDFALLFISHDLAVVRHLCERVLVMHQGVIVEQGETARVFDAPAHPYTASLLAAMPGRIGPGATGAYRSGTA